MLFALAVIVVVATVAAEIALPGRAVYHYGWFNVLLTAVAVIAFVAARKSFRAARTAAARWALVAILFGTAIAAFAGVANGLLAPDNQTVIGAPGERVRVESLGVLSFPLASADARQSVVTLQRRHGSISIGERRRETGNFIVRTFQRNVASIEARDARGNRLTITQPSGSAFLSPVLLMQHRQTIAGMDLPYDSFNVPAARRVVKAVSFSPEQTSLISHGTAPMGDTAVLFAVDDENERPLRDAIGLSVGGRPVKLGGLWLRATVGSYPAVDVVAAPNFAATLLGEAFAIGGLLVLAVRRELLPRDHRPHVA